jgi:hypothetical protein
MLVDQIFKVSCHFMISVLLKILLVGQILTLVRFIGLCKNYTTTTVVEIVLH